MPPAFPPISARSYSACCLSLFCSQFSSLPRCVCGGVIKPDVVLYEEPLDSRTTERAVGLIRAADNLIIGGTSLNVYPAAGLVQYFRGENIVVVNRSEIPVRGAVFIDAPIAQLFSMC